MDSRKNIISGRHEYVQNRDDNRWLTINQAQQAGYRVKKGERSPPIQYWSTTEKVNKIDPATGQPF